MNYAVGIVLAALGALLGWLFGRRLAPQPLAARDEAQRALDAAKSEAEQIKRDAQVESKEVLLRAQREVEAELRTRRGELEREAERITKQEAAQARKAELLANLSLLHPPFLLGLIMGGAMIYWFSGASTQAVSTGAYRAVEFIKQNIKLEGVEKASVEDSKKVVEICTVYAQRGMFNIFLAVFFSTLAFACFEPYFFIGYLVSIALFGLFQALFMANAGGAWDNAKKVVETELKAKGTDLHAATVVGDTVGDPFKDTSSVAMNPVIKFTTLFGLLAVELATQLREYSPSLPTFISAGSLAVALVFIYRSFYGMRIETSPKPTA